MKRLTKKEKEYILLLIKKGKSLNYISRLTSRYKSVIYYHYKKVLGKKYKEIKINHKDDLFIGELIGLFVGDGYCFFDQKKGSYSVRFFFNITEKDYVNKLILLFQKKLNKRPNLGRTKNVLIIKYYSKELFDLILDSVGWQLSKNVRGVNKKSRTVFLKGKNYSYDFKIGFLRGFIDSDGYISEKKIMFASASKRIMNQVRSFLYGLGFKDFKYSFYKEKRNNRVGMYHITLNKPEWGKVFSIIKPRNLVSIKSAPTEI